MDCCAHLRDDTVKSAVTGVLAALPRAEQVSMAFFPRRCRRDAVPRSPAARVAVERSVYTARDGTKIGCVYVAPTAPRADAEPAGPSLLMLRWGGNAELAADVVRPGSPFEELVASGVVRLVLADYRGFGWSEGSPSLSVLRADAEDLYIALPDLLSAWGSPAPSAAPLAVMGRSVGSHCALHLAALHAERLAGLVLDSPSACHWPLEQVPAECWQGLSDSLASAGLQLLPARGPKRMYCPCCSEPRAARAQAAREAAWLDPLDVMGAVDTRLLILGGTADTMCPRPQVEALFAESPAQQKEMVWLPGLGHNELGLSETYWQELARFLEGLKQRGPKEALA